MRKLSTHWLIALSVVVVMAAALAHVWVHLQVLAVGYDISRETKLRHDLMEANQRLSLELRTRMDLSVIERAAREQLKMVPPDPRAIRVLPVTEGEKRSEANAARRNAEPEARPPLAKR